MTAFERVRRTQRSLEVIIGSSVLFWAAATLFGLLTIGAAMSAVVALPRVVHGLIPVVAGLAAIVTFVVLAWRGRFAWSFDRVALWIEERLPELRYALVTAIDPRYQGATAQLMEPVIARADPGPFVRAAARRSTLPAALALLVALGVFLVIPKRWREQLNAADIFGPLGARAAVVGNRLIPLTATLTPPAYAHLRTETFKEPSMITGLIGSRVVLTGDGAPDGIQATLEEFPSDEPVNVPVGDSANDDSQKYEDAQLSTQQRQSPLNPYNRGPGGMGAMGGNMPPQDEARMHQGDDQGGTSGNSPLDSAGTSKAAPNQSKTSKTPPRKSYVRPIVRQRVRAPIIKPLTVTRDGKGWMVSFVLSDSNPALLKLVDRRYHRDIVVNPQVDQPPTGRLLLPLRDTTLRVIGGALMLSATFNDDIGLASAHFEYIKCTSGSGGEEDVKCTTGVYATKTFGEAKSGAFSYSVPFSSLGLKEGDQLSVRAVVIDNNTLFGPDTGVTETRTIRIARKSEYEKRDVNPSPPSADTALITLRMLLMAVKQLDREKQTMEHQRFQDSSIALGGLGQQVRTKIDQIIDEQTGGGEVPVNPLLAIAKDSMTSVVTDLYIADTHSAIPPLQIAYDALMKYSNTTKYIPPNTNINVPIVNVDRVRLKGTDSGATTPRTPRPMSDLDRERYMREYSVAVQQVRTAPDAAIDAFTLLQVETLRKYPTFSQAVADAATAIRAKKDPAAAILRARRILEGSIGTLDTLPLWSGAW